MTGLGCKARGTNERRDGNVRRARTPIYLLEATWPRAARDASATRLDAPRRGGGGTPRRVCAPQDRRDGLTPSGASGWAEIATRSCSWRRLPERCSHSLKLAWSVRCSSCLSDAEVSRASTSALKSSSRREERRSAAAYSAGSSHTGAVPWPCDAKGGRVGPGRRLGCGKTHARGTE